MFVTEVVLLWILFLAQVRITMTIEVKNYNRALSICISEFDTSFHKTLGLIESSDLHPYEKIKTINSLQEYIREIKAVELGARHKTGFSKPLLLKKCLSLLSSLQEVQVTIEGNVGELGNTSEANEADFPLKQKFTKSFEALKLKLEEFADLVLKSTDLMTDIEVKSQMDFERYVIRKLENWESFYNDFDEDEESNSKSMDRLVAEEKNIKFLLSQTNRRILQILKESNERRYKKVKSKGFLSLQGLEVRHKDGRIGIVLSNVKRRLDNYHIRLSKITRLLKEHKPASFTEGMHNTVVKIKLNEIYKKIEFYRKSFEKIRADENAKYEDCKKLDDNTRRLLGQVFLLHREVKKKYEHPS